MSTSVGAQTGDYLIFLELLEEADDFPELSDKDRLPDLVFAVDTHE